MNEQPIINQCNCLVQDDHELIEFKLYYAVCVSDIIYDQKINNICSHIIEQNYTNMLVSEKIFSRLSHISDENHQIKPIDILNCKNIDEYIACPRCNIYINSNVCPLCKFIVFENIETNVIKSVPGNFNPNKHFYDTLIRTLAQEGTEELTKIDMSIICKIKKHIENDRLILQKINVNDVRRILKRIRKTNFNKNVPQIIRILTGIGPPKLPQEFICVILFWFSKVVVAIRELLGTKTHNRNYFPYYIYKIVDAITPMESPYRAVLNFIYIQSDTTVKKNDMFWKKICLKIDLPYFALR